MMESNANGKAKANEYFANLLHQHSQKQSILGILKERQQLVEHKLQEGELHIPLQGDNKRHLANLLKKKEINPFQSHYKGFFLNFDREKSHERFEVFKKIKEEYSKEKTAIVVKEVEKKIKEWTAKKLEIGKKKQRSQDRENKIQIELIQHMRRQQLLRRESEKQYKKQQLLNRLKLMEQKREQRQEFIKKSCVRSLDVKQPKYKEIQQKFNQIEQKLREEQNRLLEHKRQSLFVNPQEIEEHAKKYEEILKQRQEERKNRLKLRLSEADLQNRESFNAFNNELRLKKKEELSKRKRMKEFQQKVKSSIIIRKKPENFENEEQGGDAINKSKVFEKQKSDIDKEITSEEGKKVRRKKRKNNDNADGRKLGNDYLNSLKEKDQQILNKTEKMPKLTSSASLPTLKPAYKNYLTEVKIKRRPIGSEIEQLKRSCQNPKQVYELLSKKSSDYEQSMMKKINQLKKINRYDESVVRQSEIDDIYSRYIKLRLACIDP